MSEDRYPSQMAMERGDTTFALLYRMKMLLRLKNISPSKYSYCEISRCGILIDKE